MHAGKAGNISIIEILLNQNADTDVTDQVCENDIHKKFIIIHYSDYIVWFECICACN